MPSTVLTIVRCISFSKIDEINVTWVSCQTIRNMWLAAQFPLDFVTVDAVTVFPPFSPIPHSQIYLTQCYKLFVSLDMSGTAMHILVDFTGLWKVWRWEFWQCLKITNPKNATYWLWKKRGSFWLLLPKNLPLLWSWVTRMQMFTVPCSCLILKLWSNLISLCAITSSLNTMKMFDI